MFPPAEDAIKIIHDHMMASIRADGPHGDPLTDVPGPYEREYGVEGPPQAKVISYTVQTIPTNILGGNMTTKQILDDVEIVLPTLIQGMALIGKWAAITGAQKMQGVLDFIFSGIEGLTSASKGGQKSTLEVLTPAIETMAQETYDGLKASGIIANTETPTGVENTQIAP